MSGNGSFGGHGIHSRLLKTPALTFVRFFYCGASIHVLLQELLLALASEAGMPRLLLLFLLNALHRFLNHRAAGWNAVPQYRWARG